MPPLFLPPQFSRDVRGTIAVVTALAAIVLLICAGAAIDYLRLIRTRTDLQAALDTATLAAAAKPGALDQTANRYFTFNGTAPQTVVTAVNFSKRSDGTVDGALTAEIPASLLQVAGFGPLRLRVVSAARAAYGETATKLTIQTTDGNSPYDKEFFVETKDRNGKVTTETLVQTYDYSCVCHSSGATFTPPKDKSVTVTVKAGETVSYKMIVYRDPVKYGNRWYPDSLLSDAANATAYVKFTGQCTDAGGQVQSWEDGLAKTYKSLILNVTCTAIPSGKPTVVLVR